jgi:hypothetical protein
MGTAAQRAALSTAPADILYFRILATAGATNLLLVTRLIPITTTILGVTVRGERLAQAHLPGIGSIGLGRAAIDGRLPARLRHLAAQVPADRARLGGASVDSARVNP